MIIRVNSPSTHVYSAESSLCPGPSTYIPAMKPVRLVQYNMVLIPAPNCEGNDLELALLVTKSLAQLTPSTSEAKAAHESPDGNILAAQSTCHSP